MMDPERNAWSDGYEQGYRDGVRSVLGLQAGDLTTDQRFGALVRVHRVARKWSQSQLGKRLEPPISHAAICDIEKGRTHARLELVERLAAIFEVEPTELIPWRGEAP